MAPDLPSDVLKVIARLAVEQARPGNRLLVLLAMAGVCKQWRELVREVPADLPIAFDGSADNSLTGGTLFRFRRCAPAKKEGTFLAGAALLTGKRTFFRVCLGGRGDWGGGKGRPRGREARGLVCRARARERQARQHPPHRAWLHALASSHCAKAKAAAASAATGAGGATATRARQRSLSRPAVSALGYVAAIAHAQDHSPPTPPPPPPRPHSTPPPRPSHKHKQT